MIKKIKLTAVICMVGLATGCATSQDIEHLQSQIDTLKTQVSTASSDAANAQRAASLAAAKATASEAAANRAARYAQDTNRKLDRMFKKSMMK